MTRTLSNDTYGYSPGTVVNRPYVPDGLNRYASVDGTNFGYDARGNLTSNGARAYAYDVQNHLTTVSGAGGTSVLLSLSYDPLGRLFQTAAATTTQFLNAGDQLVAEFDGSSGSPLRRYVHGANADEPLVWYDGAAMSNTTRRWLHSNHQGSVVGASDSAGVLVGAAYSYSAYGEPNKWSGSRFRYTGQIVLPEAQLYHYKARVYDPALGRFLQTDPVGYEADTNLYAYVKNDPLNLTDPTGMAPPGCGDGVCETVIVTATRPGMAGVTMVLPGTRAPTIPAPRPAPLIAGAILLDMVFDVSGRNCTDSGCHPDLVMTANKAPADAKDPNGAKAPGKPDAEEGFEDPKGGEKWVKGSDGRGGWLDSQGNVWQPTGKGARAHGGSHWDVQNPNGTHTNVYPGGHRR